MSRESLSLRVLAAYARDIGTGVVRLDKKSMNTLGLTAGDIVEVIGSKEGTDAKCYPLLPSDEDKGITRMDPRIRDLLNVSLEDTVFIRNLATAEKPANKEPDVNEKITDVAISDPENRLDSDNSILGASPIFILSGSCLNFDKERQKLVDFIITLESAAHSKSKWKCYSDGKKALGWDFFLLELDEGFVNKLKDLYPEIDKQEAGTMEERFALWMNRQLKKLKLDFHLKLTDVQQEKTAGFRLSPKSFRDEDDLGKLR